MTISIFTGCVIPIKYPGMEVAARFLAPLLDIELVDVKFGCCPAPLGLKEVHFDAWLALAARNLCLTEEKGLDVVTLCAGCTNTLRETNHILAQDEKKRLFVHDMLRRQGREYQGNMHIYHLPDLLVQEPILERLERQVVRPLTGLKIGTHYGCHYFRPSEVMNDGPRDPFHPLPESMEVILETLGAEIVEYNRQDLCCGAALNINAGRNPESLQVLEEKLSWMNEAGLEAVAVACPTCFTQFDTGQLLLCRREPGRRTVPAFHIAELVAYALGLTPEAMQLSAHKIKGEAVLAGLPSGQLPSSGLPAAAPV
ncbi:MAG: CoB--CoM heterodisulfide reductase iron-sulfur subunit B family protein [Spirochaetales bacterium]|nr:CoB--CoM heterodisulfide reductase iron-sulfur subunit B family protein [Spirochaetales bacterium]